MQDELNSNGYHVEIKTCDVSKRQDVNSLAKFAAGFGKVIKVVNSAGVSGTMADRETIIRINCLGTFYINQEFYKIMDGGCIVDVSSQGGYMLPKMLLPSSKTYSLVIEDEKKSEFELSNPDLFIARVGIEPTRDCSRQILSLLRLPIPPSRRS